MRMHQVSAIFIVLASARVAAQPACAVPVGHDRAAILAAAATGCVQLEPGVEYTAETPASPPGGRRPYAVIALGAGELRGAPGAVLHFTGDAGGVDWHGISLTSGSVHDLTIETGALTGTSEQTHAIRITGPASSPSVYNVTFEHPVRGSWPGGDCIQLVGYAATPILSATIHHNTFSHCDRSGVAVHGGAHDLEITDNAFTDVGDQDIDGEGSGDNFDWTISRNTMLLGAHPQGDMSIQLMLVDRVRVTDNRLWGRGVFAYSASHLELDHNTIVRTTAVSGVGAVEIDKASSYVDVHENSIVRSARAGAGYVIRTGPHGTAAPDHITIRGNTLIQANTGDVINATGIVGLTVEGNTVMYSGPSNGGYGVLAQGSAGTAPIRTTDIALTGNTWVGPLSGCLGLSGSYGGAGTAALTGNVALGPVKGLVCGNVSVGAGVTGPIAMSGNSWPAPACAGVP